MTKFLIALGILALAIVIVVVLVRQASIDPKEWQRKADGAPRRTSNIEHSTPNIEVQVESQHDVQTNDERRGQDMDNSRSGPA